MNSSNSSNKTPLIIGIIVVIIIIAAGVWYISTNPSVAASLGLASAHPPVASSTGQYVMNPNGPGRMGTTTPGNGRGGMRGGFATGSIEVLTDNGFTLSLADGTTKDVTLAATTTIQNYTSASSTPSTITADQLSVGEQVSVVGTPDTDGSIDARVVRTGAFPVRAAGGNGQYRGGTGMVPQAGQQ